ncbi:MAG: hypothetical protein ACOC7R_00050 [Planctomycetota bacterium]
MACHPLRPRVPSAVCFEPLEPRRLLSVALPAEALLDSPSAPPPGFAYLTAENVIAGTSALLSNVPEYFWYRGCAPTSAGMILGYWATLGCADVTPGDATRQTYAVNRAIASTGHHGRWNAAAETWDYDVGHSAGTVYTKRIELPDGPSALAFSYCCEVDPYGTEAVTVTAYDTVTGTKADTSTTSPSGRAATASPSIPSAASTTTAIISTTPPMRWRGESAGVRVGNTLPTRRAPTFAVTEPVAICLG